MNLVNVRLWGSGDQYSYNIVAFSSDPVQSAFASLYENTSETIGLPVGTFKLILCGRAICPTEEAEDEDIVALRNATVIHCIVKRTNVLFPNGNNMMILRANELKNTHVHVALSCGLREEAFTVERITDMDITVTFARPHRTVWIGACRA